MCRTLVQSPSTSQSTMISEIDLSQDRLAPGENQTRVTVLRCGLESCVHVVPNGGRGTCPIPPCTRWKKSSVMHLLHAETHCRNRSATVVTARSCRCEAERGWSCFLHLQPEPHGRWLGVARESQCGTGCAENSQLGTS